MIIGSATVQANQLSGLRGLGDNCTSDNETGETVCFDSNGNVTSDVPGVVTSAGGGNGSIGLPTSSSNNASSGFNWGGLFSTLIGNAASLTSQALRSSSQTCQVINGQTVCNTTTTGGMIPLTTVGTSSLFGGNSLFLWAGVGLVAVMLLKRK